MNPQTIQQLMLIRAVEESDMRGEQLPFSEREDATRQAIAETGDAEKAPTIKSSIIRNSFINLR